jgi:Fe-S-cluster-containing hydrogenase component 2
LPEGKDYIEIYGESAQALLSPDKSDEAPKEQIAANSPELKINEAQCTQCGLCADNCPVNNIDCSVSPPVFKAVNCFRCYYCEGICPTGAIECDFSNRVINVEPFKFFNKALDAAEAKGRFRRLVPAEDIGWTTPWGKSVEHPRLKVL